ncbi:hypothetical protein CR513_28934, partial [Mucuna pruriens]
MSNPSLPGPDRIRLPRASRHSTLSVSYITLFPTLSHNQTHCVLERIQPKVDYTIVSFSLFDACKTTKSRVIKLVSLPETQALLSSSDPLHDLDPKIEITLRRLRRDRNIVVNIRNSSNFVSSSDNSSFITNNSNSFEYSSTNNFVEPE